MRSSSCHDVEGKPHALRLVLRLDAREAPSLLSPGARVAATSVELAWHLTPGGGRRFVVTTTSSTLVGIGVSATLDALRSMSASKFDGAITSGALVQCMLLRAELARSRGRAESVKWARAVAALSDSTKPQAKNRIRRVLVLLK